MSGQPDKKVLVQIDMSLYEKISRDVNEHLGEQGTALLDKQIQGIIQGALLKVKTAVEDPPYWITGDGGRALFDDPDTADRFAEAVHQRARDHNQGKANDYAQRHFRVGIATGRFVEPGGADPLQQLSGYPIVVAVRSEGHCKTGEILICPETRDGLSEVAKRAYSLRAEEFHDKNGSPFYVHRRKVVDPAPWQRPRMQPVGGGTRSLAEQLKDRPAKVRIRARFLNLLAKHTEDHQHSFAEFVGMTSSEFRTRDLHQQAKAIWDHMMSIPDPASVLVEAMRQILYITEPEDELLPQEPRFRLNSQDETEFIYYDKRKQWKKVTLGEGGDLNSEELELAKQYPLFWKQLHKNAERQLKVYRELHVSMLVCRSRSGADPIDALEKFTREIKKARGEYEFRLNRRAIPEPFRDLEKFDLQQLGNLPHCDEALNHDLRHFDCRSKQFDLAVSAINLICRLLLKALRNADDALEEYLKATITNGGQFDAFPQK